MPLSALIIRLLVNRDHPIIEMYFLGLESRRKEKGKL